MAATIIDSNVIIDVLDPTSRWADWAKRGISAARLHGELVFNVVIAAEVAHERPTELPREQHGNSVSDLPRH